MKREIEGKIHELETNNIISRCDSNVASPVVMIRKKDHNTYNEIRKLCYWNTMGIDVHQFVRQCIKCQTKSDKTNHGLLKPISANVPMELICVDVMGPLRVSNGYKYVYVMIDHFSKFIFIKPLKYNNASEVVKCSKQFFNFYGAPLKLLSDNGVQFTSKLFEQLCTEYQVKHLRTTTYTPNSNGLVERANRTIKNLLKIQLMNFKIIGAISWKSYNF
jgi:transposase InsO family protein